MLGFWNKNKCWDAGIDTILECWNKNKCWDAGIRDNAGILEYWDKNK
jgi:hypothetical protein